MNLRSKTGEALGRVLHRELCRIYSNLFPGYERLEAATYFSTHFTVRFLSCLLFVTGLFYFDHKVAEDLEIFFC